MRLQIPFSVVDFSILRLGETPREALQQTVDLARHVEALGFKRFWLTEHHGVLSSASAATSVVIGHVAGKTSVIRIGSGGVMLPNHPPLVIAERSALWHRFILTGSTSGWVARRAAMTVSCGPCAWDLMRATGFLPM